MVLTLGAPYGLEDVQLHHEDYGRDDHRRQRRLRDVEEVRREVLRMETKRSNLQVTV